MSAQIYNLAVARQSAKTMRGSCERTLGRQAVQPAQFIPTQSELVEHFEFWSGASKERYVHTVYTLIECPELPQANYMLVRRARDGSTSILQIGHTQCQTGSENLAAIRHSAATLGANEVHVHYLPKSDNARELIELDLRAGQFGSLSAQPTQLLH